MYSELYSRNYVQFLQFYKNKDILKFKKIKF